MLTSIIRLEESVISVTSTQTSTSVTNHHAMVQVTVITLSPYATNWFEQLTELLDVFLHCIAAIRSTECITALCAGG